MSTIDVSQVLNLLVMAADDGDLNAVKYLAHKADYLARQCAYNVSAPEPDIDIREALMRGARGGDDPYKAEHPGKKESAARYRRSLREQGYVPVKINGNHAERPAEKTAWVMNDRRQWKRVMRDSGEFRSYVENGGAYFPGDSKRPTVAAMRSIANRFSREDA